MSLSMAATRALLRFRARSTETEDSLVRSIARQGSAAPVTRAVCRVATVEEARIGEVRVVTLRPRRPASGVHVVYLHGGAYVHPVLSTHWTLLAGLVRASGAVVTVPLYGLAPAHDVDEVLPLLDAVLDEVRRASPSRIVLAGDSAGGALALVAAMRERDAGRPAPDALVLFSPWVDALLDSPAIDEVAPLDPMLGRDGLVAAGRWWAGDRDAADPTVSPVRGDLSGLPPVFAYAGDRDLLTPDVKRLARGLVAAGGRAELRMYRGAFHVFVGAPWTPEARRALRHAASVIRGDAATTSRATPPRA
ncbi:alpha/beta hydrolase fold domain-containing protein [Frigoribacterium sp. VKM Ac-2836]|uniref:alpha/beta hydrolase fold domain-containing protein n=1 Tax=Frigoribacterium sp. VKM Ac-2836 TaxID=2739014 RepID=UPI0015636DA1|nr:alpha/beta hydrolase fold domain-containing protein [Frigoribacterium sp. VKM Ac-2836]NRD26070.1 alpha/beta hydrolase fold domain-containing protein [Frigoribacterium sp. VKM Ac-2836]